MAEDSSSKKFLVSNFNNYKMVDSRPVMEQYNELLRILGQYTQHGLIMDESISVSSIIDKLPPSWKDFKHTLKHGKDDMSLVELGSHLRIEESLSAQDSNKGKGKEVGGPSVNMTEEGGISEVVKRTTQMLVVRERGLRTNPKTNVDAVVWWIDSGAITHVCKDRCWLKIYEPVEDGSVLYMGDDHFAHVHGKGSVALEFSSRKTITLFNVLYVPKLRHVHYKRMLEKSKDDLIHDINENMEKSTTCNKKYVITFIDDASRFCYVYLLRAKDEALDKFRICKTEVELQQNDLVKTLCTDRGGEYYDPIFFQSVGIIHETTAPYTPQQNGVAERKIELLRKWVPIKRNNTTPYELWYKKRPNLAFLRVWGFRAVVRLPDPKRKTFGENIEEDSRTYNKAMQSRDSAFWKEAIDDEIGSNVVLEGNWVSHRQ
nr:hypothetical protein [Tanacetum cinerariifolium]